MPIEIKEVPSLVILAEAEAEAEPEIEPGFYLGSPTPSVEKEGLQVYPVVFSKEKGSIIGFFLRVPEGLKIGQCTGQDVRDYQEAEGVVLDPFHESWPLNETDPVLVVGQDSQQIFIMRPELGVCFARWYDSSTKKTRKIEAAYANVLQPVYGFTIESDPSEGLVLSADSYINLSSY